MTRVQKCLAFNIKKYRKAQSLTQEQLAERAKSSTTYIGTIEIGQKFPSPQMIERIAAALNVDSLQLFQPDSGLLMEKQFDVEKLKDSLIKNIEKAVEMTMKEI
ncbi:MAG: helix-turn-helix transcriptional regulator [Treponema sp.]|nr:helix-turn-helix transcriptional regulator [Treponema sp.]